MSEHLEKGECPACHAPGVYDMDSPPGTTLRSGTNWIWYNDFIKSWECGECWLK